MRSTAIVVHYGAPAPTIAVASAVRPLVTEVVVVVNDGSARPAALPHDVEWLVMKGNVGYGAAFMHAARGRGSDVYVLLNNDLEFPAGSFARCLATLAADPRTGVVGPVLRFADGRLQSGAARLSRFRRAPRPRIEPGGAATDCEWVTGAAMFLRREVVEQVGMDGSYFLGHEDADLCLRARRAGYRVVCEGSAPVVHHGAQVISGPRWSYYSPRNRVWFARRHFGCGAALLAWAAEVAVLPRVLLADVVKRRDLTSSRLRLLAAVHAWRRLPAPCGEPLPGEPLAGRVMRW
jgi:N-acetylglucosaminyl-diphospho-decaprenol L-rhamnosyltransferase